MIKKIFSLFLAVLMCVLALVGCSQKDEAPDGMQLVSLDGEPFKLYVPESWRDNRTSGISSAYYSAADKILVSARYFTPEDQTLTLDAHAEQLSNSYSQTLKLYTLLSKDAAILGGADALELKYTAEQDGRIFTYRQLIAKHGSDLVLLTFFCPSELYETNSSQFDSIVEVFVLCDRGEVQNDNKTDKKTPEGMKIASSDDIEYRLYVPTSWICYSESGRSEAYVSESGKPNVTVTSYSPDSDMTAEQYFAMCEAEYKTAISGYELVSTADRNVAERDAKVYTYRASYGEVSFTVMQTVLVYSDMVYSITYTALSDRFDAHMADVDAILDSFTFR